ncbi:zinc-ribbon domain-containing protein [Kitasatospora sp. NPDC059747]|uniref:zinc-ribbon domain-containing protein n=1 Tax=Kitasatospora sp. NPDC059747 TaxID=3346930 RepID=UPI0036494E47
MADSGLTFVRVREEGLPQVPGRSITVTGRFGARTWAQQMATIFIEHGVTWNELTEEQVAVVLGAVHRTWSERAGRPEESALDRAPRLAGEFLANRTRHGVGLEWLSPGAEDMILWRCATCSHEWTATVNDRAASGYGCNTCGTRRAAKKRSTPKPGESLAETHPDVADEFVRCLTRPEATPRTMRAGANERCEFRCSAPGCGHVWRTHLPNRTRPDIRSGCPICARRRESKVGRVRQGRSLQSDYPALAAEFGGCTEEPDRTADRLAPNSALTCRWHCGECGHTWTSPARMRVKNYNRSHGTACPDCGHRLRNSNSKRQGTGGYGQGGAGTG